MAKNNMLSDVKKSLAENESKTLENQDKELRNFPSRKTSRACVASQSTQRAISAAPRARLSSSQRAVLIVAHKEEQLRTSILLARKNLLESSVMELAKRDDVYFDPINNTLGFGKTYGERSINGRPIDFVIYKD